MEGGRILLPIFSRLLGKTLSEFLMRTVISVIDLAISSASGRGVRATETRIRQVYSVSFGVVSTGPRMLGVPDCPKRYRRPLRRSGPRHMRQQRHRITSSVEASSAAIGLGVPHDGHLAYPDNAVCGSPVGSSVTRGIPGR